MQAISTQEGFLKLLSNKNLCQSANHEFDKFFRNEHTQQGGSSLGVCLRIDDFVRKIQNVQRIVDIGCGTGGLAMT